MNLARGALFGWAVIVAGCGSSGSTEDVPSYGFGNKDSDVQAYSIAGIDPSHCYYYGLNANLNGGNSHDDYTSLIPMAAAAPASCF